jgi:RNA polymerase sigma-70 factor, ECF subfamily
MPAYVSRTAERVVICKVQNGGKPGRSENRLHRAMEFAASPRLISSMSENIASTADELELELMSARYRSKVYRFILASLRDPDAAETLTQDCFLKAYQARASFRGESSLETWLMQIAVNLVRDHSRNRKLRFWRRTQTHGWPVESVREWLADDARSPESAALLKQEVAAVWTAAEDLPERQRTVFLLRFVEEMELLEIAAATGMKEGTVKTHLFRALRAVREKMGARR